ncbi:MAG: hypothetical protein H0A76_05765 [Candidatus Thiodubiliella endoseptemdiera]|uniref:Uncharacterized protein n=1 Tax=Candidatus Thiodubiliella endoseptemdiera TaxID=2738886 RepID=A0A853F6S4_9GAMM|nr:hypothetical protein [Candidatus Thiodubiliella endoseptemdiera]
MGVGKYDGIPNPKKIQALLFKPRLEAKTGDETLFNGIDGGYYSPQPWLILMAMVFQFWVVGGVS